MEIDATWYRTPSAHAVVEWNRKTPDEFVFAAKVPQVVTHEKVLVDAEAELEAFVTVMRRLGSKLGTLLLQFPYFRREAPPGLDAFLERLPGDVPFALEVRNKGWLQPALFEGLRPRTGRPGSTIPGCRPPASTSASAAPSPPTGCTSAIFGARADPGRKESAGWGRAGSKRPEPAVYGRGKHRVKGSATACFAAGQARVKLCGGRRTRNQ